VTLILKNPTLGLEEVQRAAFYILFERLNDAIGLVESYWTPLDEERSIRTGIPIPATTLERVLPGNFHEGHRPSLLRAPIEAYPNVAVMAFRATPGPGSDLFDHVDVYRDQLWIEMMVKSQIDEVETNRRAQRMAAAVNTCMIQNQSLEGIVSGLETGPTAVVSDLFVRKERTSYGAEWYWQGARLEYSVRKETVVQPPQFFDIDQG